MFDELGELNCKFNQLVELDEFNELDKLND